ncbi:uncharacterized protein APUU_12383S [Aspergillus puulaauensis]|uniref:Uncharacterized protein n=1 Tax=Aspergillus puulaauensis TaxID=1220207 RepID=A0A7R8AJE4_9EURO|nr:uncharacterized protein APUU_12383S [Aspergillus puulaauensis]BCS19555.1 hypothetical protein APUU_12383S [Aspergillus puulaauensis]
MEASTEDGEDSRLSLSREYYTISIAVVVSTTKFIVTVGTLQFSNTAKSRHQMNPLKQDRCPVFLVFWDASRGELRSWPITFGKPQQGGRQ